MYVCIVLSLRSDAAKGLVCLLSRPIRCGLRHLARSLYVRVITSCARVRVRLARVRFVLERRCGSLIAVTIIFPSPRAIAGVRVFQWRLAAEEEEFPQRG